MAAFQRLGPYKSNNRATSDTKRIFDLSYPFGPARVVAEEIADIEGALEVYIFGSWAARYHGVEGEPPRDIDVLVVGSPNRDEVYEAALRVEHRLQREVNATIRSKASWDASRDGFLRQVRSSPIVSVIGTPRSRTQAE